ncbi:hypothetical protein AKN87_07455 [Thiopseudomonas alkaliphila]|uniref:hypothetical protein n=1 Tax=Thiopseudomonas alkaliphila TaxID=1697053 RepID=UPI00069CE085|nr:hypothetical protein [Thiopseudomonas alkaliphila]AKX44945.1 hypothetical protein AKN87_07455 [Thiopseudomonas alkaliphila]
MQDRMEESRNSELSEEKKRHLNDRERELLRYRKVIENQEREFDAYRSRLKDEQIKREMQLRKELEERERHFVEREKKLVERQRDFEKHLQLREIEAQELRNRLQNELSIKESKLKKAFIKLEQEKARLTEESRRKLEQTSQDYVADALDALNSKEKQFHTISKIWSGIGAASLIVGVIIFVAVTFSINLDLLKDISWQFLVFALFKGITTVGLLVGVAKYSFLFSSSYMQESLKNADRRHAINFGKFYLESYGAAADWSEVKEAFEHWNITGSNAFSNREDVALDNSALEKAISLLEKAGKIPEKIKDAVKA